MTRVKTTTKTSVKGLTSGLPVSVDPDINPAQELLGKRVHFVGIGGCGMSGLARIAKNFGAVCTGSDRSDSEAVRSLNKDGISTVTSQTTESVPAKCDMMVISAAIPKDHPEVVEAQRRGVQVIKYAKMLGRLMIGRVGIAVAGTHGKSSTTSMVSHALIHAGLDPSLIVGANCAQIGGGSRSGNSDILVAEACEFDWSFHNFHPTKSVILNVEEDHMEIYHTLDNLVESFAKFARLLPEESKGGFLLLNHDMPHKMRITAGLKCRVETIGFSNAADWRVSVDESTRTQHAGWTPCVKLYHRGDYVAGWQSPLPGEHMAYNACAAAVLAHEAGASWEKIQEALEGFAGLDRRMQKLGVKKVDDGEVVVVDDYGHHPTEVDTTLRALRRHYRPKRLICVFQPHQHSRTRFLLEQFAQSFSEADIVVVPHIYFVRDSEAERLSITAGDLVDKLRQRKKQAMHLYPFGAITEQLQVTARPGDLVVTMGAGDVYKIGLDFLRM
jgi:UDP-N-acetylmuramate--alanine ligase